VVPAHKQIWQTYPKLHLIQLADIPLTHTYGTLGVDRALAVWGAGNLFSFPVLVIDGGTALALTAATAPDQFVGGAILPGIGTQLRSLSMQTAALPELSWNTGRFPERWGQDTETAIRSGVFHTLLAGLQGFMEDWWQMHPHSPVVFTGGDGVWLYPTLLKQNQSRADLLKHEPHLQFWAIQKLRQQIVNP
jgi:type III pantothenate kinase